MAADAAEARYSYRDDESEISVNETRPTHEKLDSSLAERLLKEA